MQLKGGNLVGLVARDEQGNETFRLEMGDGGPLVFLVEDENGRIHELFLSVGRMGTFTQFTLPPFKVEDQFQTDDGAVAQSGLGASERQALQDGVPVATRPKRSGRTRNTAQV